MIRKLALMLGMVALAVPTTRGDVVIDFEGLAWMGNSPGSSVPSSAQLSSQFLATDGVVFSSDSPFVAVVNLGQNHATSGDLGIGGVDGLGHLNYGSPINAAFFLPTDTSTAAVTDFVSVRADLSGISGPITLQAFGVNGLVLATSTEDDQGGPTLMVAAAGIHSVRFFSSSGSVAFDDFSFGTLRPVAAVPEPASLSMLIGGALGLLGYASSRRRRPSGPT